jgi:Myotubularin-like phosphatase domain
MRCSTAISLLIAQLSYAHPCMHALLLLSTNQQGWLGHVRAVLSASWVTAYNTHHHGVPVLVHCSHGWDRTSQVPTNYSGFAVEVTAATYTHVAMQTSSAAELQRC